MIDVVADSQVPLVPDDVVAFELQRRHMGHPLQTCQRSAGFRVNETQLSSASIEERDARPFAECHIKAGISGRAQPFEIADAIAHRHRIEA
jgi:hypothetical protein